MKTISILLITFLVLSVNTLFAGNDRDFMPAMHESAAVAALALGPVTPAEASFDEASAASVTDYMINCLAPATPSEAGFDDEADNTDLLQRLAPVTPDVAEFSDSATMITITPTVLAPTTPAFADLD